MTIDVTEIVRYACEHRSSVTGLSCLPFVDLERLSVQSARSSKGAMQEAIINEMERAENSAASALGVPGLFRTNVDIPTVVKLAQHRQNARNAGDYKSADAFRAEIEALGCAVIDKAA